MLKDKYVFEHNSNSVYWLHKCLNDAWNANCETRNSICALSFLSLKPLIDRLEKKAKTLDKKKIKVKLNRTEAIAFHVACKAMWLDQKLWPVQEIFTAIDRTI